MDDGEIREVAHRFFDAVETRDLKTMADLYDDDLAFWFNATDRTSNKAENLAAVEAGNPRHRRRLYSERIINTYEGGFVMQYTLEITQHSGARTVLFPCVVVACRDGKITRIDEYIDSGKFSRPMPKAAETEATA